MKQIMTFKIGSELDTEYYNVRNIYPLCLEDFNKKIIKISVSGERVSFFDGNMMVCEGDHWFEARHALELNTFVLCAGGWLPPAYTITKNYMADRNILSYIEENGAQGYKKFLDWFDVLKNATDVKFSSVFSAVERNSVFLGCKEDFISNFSKDNFALQKYFGYDATYPVADIFLSSLYEFVNDKQSENIVEFLSESIPLIIDEVKISARTEKAILILCIAKKYNVSMHKHIVILCLSCLYSTDSVFARKILKPSRNYCREKAFNCINDTIFIDLILMAQKYLSSDFCGITSDKNLAKYWCALNPKLISGDVFSYEFDFSRLLFNSASESDVKLITKEIGEL